MTQTKGIDWTHVSFVVGTRADLALNPLPQPIFTRQCENCRTDTYTEAAFGKPGIGK
jgi:hypothetical protein